MYVLCNCPVKAGHNHTILTPEITADGPGMFVPEKRFEINIGLWKKI